jgi:hypothetical protein
MVLSAVPVVRHTKFMVVLVEKDFFLPVTEKAHRYSKKIMEDINACERLGSQHVQLQPNPAHGPAAAAHMLSSRPHNKL